MIGVYIVGGYPDLDTFIKQLEILKNSKVDFVEIGLPFNDPVADGPVIAKAIEETVKNGYSIDEILEASKNILNNKKLYIMTYSNLVYNCPSEKFEQFNGLIIADCPNRLHSFFYKKGLKVPIIPFATPETRKKDIKFLKKSKGDFVYFIGLRGTTGGKIDFDCIDFSVIKDIKKNIQKKIVWGFGIKNKSHIEKVLRYVDGVIIGTELVKVQNKIEDFEKFIKSI